jgi:hypothetical protein
MKHIVLLAASLLALVPGLAPALDVSTRAVGPVQEWTADDLRTFDPQWLHVKFVEGSNVLLAGGRFVDDSGLDVAGVNAELARVQVLEARATFSHDRATLRAWKAAGESRSGVTGPDLSLWFDVRVAGGPAELARVLNALNASSAVEIAHPAPVCEVAAIEPAIAAPAPPPGGGIRTPDFSGNQGYLYATPTGLNAPAAWAIAGGKGAGLDFIDVELCWTEDHEDFPFADNFYVGGAAQDPGYETHGTAVLGEVIGQHNGFGIQGFSPDVRYGVVAVTVSEWPNVPHYFQEAIDHLDYGDVWLIELQMYPPGKSATPMEWLQVNYDVIWTGCWSRGVVCMEAGANGSQNLDDASWGGVFDRDVRDSGAIMIGAGTPTGRVAESFTNYGSRMDAHAWGSQIVTTGYGDLYNGGTLQTRYTAGFSGTSGASPMVTGSGLCLQGIALANLSYVLDPITLRGIITDTGIANLGTRYIGPRPDLGAASAAVLQLADAPEGAGAIAWRVQSAPNPFQSRAEIRFDAPQAGRALLTIYDASGRKIRTLLDGAVGAGPQRLQWDGTDESGRDLGSGVYFYRLDADGNRSTGRVQKLR